MSLTESEATVAVETHFHSNWVETNIFWNQVPEFPTVGTEFVSFWMVPAGTLPSTTKSSCFCTILRGRRGGRQRHGPAGPPWRAPA